MAFTRLSMAARVLLLMLACLLWCSNAEQQQRLLVDMTNVPIEKAKELGAYCLDGSLPAYHLHKGSGSGVSNWLLQFEGGGWCNDMATCLERAQTRRGSTRYMNKKATFSGILSNDPSSNPDFYNWNRVKLRYCDGASFAGDAIVDNGTSPLYFRGQKIWQAIIEDLLPQGLAQAEKALLSGCSAGGLAAFLHCNNFASSLPKSATVKCLGDAGFFIDVADISNNYTARSFYGDLISLQGIEPNLDKKCTGSEADPKLCIFPQYSLKYTDVPFFVLNAAYDVYQFHHHFVPPSADPKGHWKRCKDDIAACRPDQLEILQNFREEMIKALDPYKKSPTTGMYINSCFAHCQSESQDTWLAADSPKVENTGIAQAVGDWYFERNVAKLIDCPYPCDTTCHNLVESENKDKQED